MKFTCEQDNLQKALNAVSRAIPNRSSLPITNHVLLESGQEQLIITATDAETLAITYSIPANVGEVALYHYLTYLTTPAPLTLFDGI